ncbi:MAG TPA: hypothetical protein VGA96_03745 [Fibrella sp.]
MKRQYTITSGLIKPIKNVITARVWHICCRGDLTSDDVFLQFQVKSPTARVTSADLYYPYYHEGFEPGDGFYSFSTL